MTLSKFAFSDVTAFPTLPFWSIEYIYTAYWQSASEVPALISVCLPDSLCAYCVRCITYRVCMVHHLTPMVHRLPCTVHHIFYCVCMVHHL